MRCKWLMFRLYIHCSEFQIHLRRVRPRNERDTHTDCKLSQNTRCLRRVDTRENQCQRTSRPDQALSSRR